MVDLLFIVAPIVCGGSVIGLCFVILVTVSFLWLILAVPWVGLLCMIVIFPDHTHLLSCEFLWV